MFEAEYRACYRSLWSLALGLMGRRDDAEEVLQEATADALRRSADFTPGTNFRAWMAQFVRYTALNHRRRKARQRERFTEAPDPGGLRERERTEQASAASVASSTQAHLDDDMLRALNRLEDTARACLLLRVLEGRSYAEIARMLQIPEGTAMSHVHRARSAMRKHLGARESNDV